MDGLDVGGFGRGETKIFLRKNVGLDSVEVREEVAAGRGGWGEKGWGQFRQPWGSVLRSDWSKKGRRFESSFCGWFGCLGWEEEKEVAGSACFVVVDCGCGWLGRRSSGRQGCCAWW